jgi:hypothetical protein
MYALGALLQRKAAGGDEERGGPATRRKTEDLGSTLYIVFNIVFNYPPNH